LYRSFWYFSVGSLGNTRKLLDVRNVCTFLEYYPVFMITTVLPLSACAIIAYPVASFRFSFFITYSCLFVENFGG
jgi:hypothetical protein